MDVPKLFDLSSDVAVVTGAGRGIGEGIASVMAGAGAAVVLAARRTAEIEKVAESIRDEGGRAISCTTDVTDAAAVDALARKAVDEFGRLDIWVNNAGGSPLSTPLRELPREEWDATLELNLTAIWTCTTIAARYLQEGGRILNISSKAAVQTIPGRGGQGCRELTDPDLCGRTRTQAPRELHHAGCGANRDHDEGLESERRATPRAGEKPTPARGSTRYARRPRSRRTLSLLEGVFVDHGRDRQRFGRHVGAREPQHKPISPILGGLSRSITFHSMLN